MRNFRFNFRTTLFILPVNTQPRFSKRIRSYQAENVCVTVGSFERDYFDKNVLPENIEYHSLGKIESGNYIKRLPKLIMSVFKIFPLSKGVDRVYIFSSDILILLAPFVQSKKLMYELGDIREIKNSKKLQKIFNFFYKKSLRKCSKIFVTSEAFKLYLIQVYNLNKSKIVVLENKIASGTFSLDNNPKDFEKISTNFTVGIIGLLRYKNIIDFLKTFSNSQNNYIIKIFGDGPLKKEIEPFVNNENIFYYGQFKYPDDLQKIYDQIDVSFTMYDSDDLNVRLALPNKLYETIYFRKPILVSSNTFLSEKVNEFNVGVAWDQGDYKGLCTYLNSEEFVNYYNSLKNSFSLINENVYIERHETNHTRP